MIRALVLSACLAFASAWVATPAFAVYTCGGVKDDCKCGGNNPYPCCDNGGNCTWYAWHAACCTWGVALPGWGNANTWAKYASGNAKYSVGGPVVGAIATSNQGQYGHVAHVIGVGNGKVTVNEENCCGSCKGGMGTKTYNASYFNSGYIVKKGGGPPPGPVCGNGKCEGGENCSNCGQDCGNCCGNGSCDNGENCASCGKDCGSCCGNGKCDNGENCSTCDKDCGSCCGNGACDYGEKCETCNADCHCLPSGSLDAATCSSVKGWAWDSDAGDKQVSVRVLSGGSEQAMLTANGPYAGHEGRGFAWNVPQTMKNGQVCTVSAEALDTQTPGKTELGTKSFLCDNSSSQEGIWTTQRTDAAGIDVSLAKSHQLGLNHVHPTGFAYPLSGVVQSCTTLALEPYDMLVATATWDLKSAQHQVNLTCDGVTQKTWQGDSGTAVALAVQVTATQLCVRTEALAQVEAPLPASFSLQDLQWRTPPSTPMTTPWWQTYSADAAGLIVGHSSPDAVVVRARAGQSVAGRGWVRAWIDLPEMFDTVKYAMTSQHNAGGLTVPGLVIGKGDATLLLAKPGEQVVRGLQANRLGVQTGVPVEAELPGDLAVTVEHLRVMQNTTRQDGPWTVGKHDAWGLDAGVPADAPTDATGMALALRLLPMGWWTTGEVTATFEVDGAAFERVRGQLQRRLGATPVQLAVLADDAKVATLPGTGTEVEAFDLAASGHRLTLALAMTQDRDGLLPQEVRFDGVELLRRGWWSAGSPFCAGLRDDRIEGGVRLETVKAWGLLDRVTQGHDRVHKTFVKAQRGVRFHYKQDLSGLAMRVLVLADGLPLKVFDDPGAAELDVELQTEAFHDLAFVLATKDQGGVYPYEWFAEITKVQVQDADGAWHKVETQASAPTPGVNVDAGGADAGVSVASASGAQGSGCDAGHAGGAGPAGALALLLFAALVARRRRA